MLSQGFIQGKDEPCSFYNPKTHMTVLAYVDDIICRGSDSATQEFYSNLTRRFDCKDPSYLAYDNPLHFIGFDIKLTRDELSDIISIDQSDTIKEFLKVHEAKPVYNIKSPMATSYIDKDSPLLSPEDKVRYQSIVGPLNYFAQILRRDISFPANRLSHHSARRRITGLIY